MTMNRIVWHHTGGGYRPNVVDQRAYHKLVDGDGEVHDGLHRIENNAPGRPMNAGTYAAHTKGLNTGAIGISICCMLGGFWSRPRDSSCFPRPVQIDALVAETARLCAAYSIEVSRRTTLSHAEVEPTLGIKQAAKWDFDYDPWARHSNRDPIAIGDDLRAEVTAALRKAGPIAVVGSPRPMLRQGMSGPDVKDLQRLLGVTVDGSFGPRTRGAVVMFQRRKQLLPDGNVGRMTWAALASQP